MAKTNPWEKIERQRREDVWTAAAFLQYPYGHSELELDWAKRVMENEQKAIASETNKG